MDNGGSVDLQLFMTGDTLLGKCPSCGYCLKIVGVGDIKCVQKKRTGGAICCYKKCGLEQTEHYSEPTEGNGPDLITDHVFEKVQLRVVGVMSHKEWTEKINAEILKEIENSKTPYPVKYGLSSLKTEYEKESRLECFNTVEGWLAWYPAHKTNINATWRIELERVI